MAVQPVTSSSSLPASLSLSTLYSPTPTVETLFGGSISTSLTYIPVSTITFTASSMSDTSAAGGLATRTDGSMSNPTSSSTSATNSSQHFKSSSAPKGLHAGAVAGIAIGTAVAGAVLALLFVFLFSKRGRKLNRSPVSESSHGLSNSDYNDAPEEKAIISRQAVLPESLIERADDSEIRKMMDDLNEVIDQHCENYYNMDQVDARRAEVERHIIEVGYNDLDNSGLSTRDVEKYLVDPVARFSAIRYIIALLIVSHFDFSASADVSLLPPQIAGILSTIAPAERGSEEAFEKALLRWRQVTSFLLQPTRNSRQAPRISEQELHASIDRNVQIINTVLRPFIKSGPDGEHAQERNLRAIIFEGAQLGFLVFCQPSTYLFDWTPVTNTGRKMVVFPALGEVIEKHGRKSTRLISGVVEVDV